MRNAGAIPLAGLLAASIFSPARGTDTPRFAAAALKLRAGLASAQKTIDGLDARLLELGASVPEAKDDFARIHDWLAGGGDDSVSGGLASSREELSAGLSLLSRAPRTCAGATQDVWEKAVEGHNKVHAAVREASRTRLRLEQARRFDARFADLQGVLRRKKFLDPRINKVASFRRTYRAELRKAAALMDQGLGEDILFQRDPDVGADCPGMSVGEDIPAPAVSASYAAGGPSERAKRALDWSADQLPQGSRSGVNSNTGESLARDKHAWDWWCLAFVATAYGRQVEELRAPSAIASYKKFVSAGKLSTSRANIPAGAPVFFEATKRNKYYGHVAIFTGRYTESGDPVIRTTGWTSWPGIHEVALSDFEKMTGAAYSGFGLVDS